MGCGACIGNKSVSVPLGYASALETALFWNIKKDLKPSRLVPQSQFSEITRQLQLSALSHRKDRKIVEHEPEVDQSLALTENEKLRLKWKLLVFCFEDDFYEPQEYDTISLGLEHPCFLQIQKDIQRTFPGQKFFQSPDGIIIFQRLLKRIALFFPHVGYTQGINFIVGYLLVLQFSQEQAFWIVVHMAMSPRFLLLGFFEDGFPMSTLYCRFLNSIFQSSLPNLYNHFEEMGVAGEAWMFKWFMTYYLYSFPMDIAREVWSLVMLKGGIGMVYFGFALLKELEKELFQFNQATQVIGFLQNLKDISTFNSLIDIKSLLQRAYSIEISNEQLQTQSKKCLQENSTQSFYVKFFTQSTHKQKQKEIYKKWHQKLRKDRIQFRTKERIVLQDNGIKIIKKINQPNVIRINKPPRQSRFRIKQQQFKKTKQKNFLQKSSLKESSFVDKEIPSYVNRSKLSSRQSKASQIIQVSSISNNLQISNHSSSSKDHHMSRIPSQESFIVDETNSTHRELTENQISDGEVTARVNASVHVITQPSQIYHRSSKQQDVEIFDLHQPFKKKKQGERFMNQNNRMKQHIIHFPENLQNLNKKQSQKTVIEIGPTNIIYRQQTIYSIDPSQRSVIDFEASNGYGESLDFRYRTPQTIKSHQGSIQHE